MPYIIPANYVIFFIGNVGITGTVELTSRLVCLELIGQEIKSLITLNIEPEF